MFDLPWWMFGTVPSDDESLDEQMLITEQEIQSDSQVGTPIKNCQTPVRSNVDETDGNTEQVVENEKVDLPTLNAFLASVSRRSSMNMEREVNKSDEDNAKKTPLTDSNRKTRLKKSFNRSETEVMHKSLDGEELVEEDPYFGIPNDYGSEFVYVDARETHHQELDDSLDLNNAVDEEDLQAGAEKDESAAREFPMFFTSFDDTTVLFNTTIQGDIDVDKSEKNAAIGDWVLKGNKFLEEHQTQLDLHDIEGSSSPFKAPTLLTKKSTPKIAEKSKEMNKERSSGRKSRSEVDLTDEPKVKRTRVSKRIATESKSLESVGGSSSEKKLKEQRPTSPSITTPRKKDLAAPSFKRRLTPSRKAKENVAYAKK